MGRFDQLTHLTPQPIQQRPPAQENHASPALDKPKASPPIQPSPAQSTKQSTRKFMKQSTKQSTEPNDKDVVNKPKGFYITHRLDKRLNHAVKYLQEKHGIKKVDRSLVINALLDTDATWTDEALDHLVDPIINILTSRLLS
jgi:hypothetical protein